jgi:hypothetical protein
LSTFFWAFFAQILANCQISWFSALSKFDEFVKSLLSRHPGESRGPELVEFTGFRRSPE